MVGASAFHQNLFRPTSSGIPSSSATTEYDGLSMELQRHTRIFLIRRSQHRTFTRRMSLVTNENGRRKKNEESVGYWFDGVMTSQTVKTSAYSMGPMNETLDFDGTDYVDQMNQHRHRAIRPVVNSLIDTSSSSLPEWTNRSFENMQNAAYSAPSLDSSLGSSSYGKRKSVPSDCASESDREEFKHPKVDFDGMKKKNHREIEKRRRDKMNTYIVELSSLLPTCNSMTRKLDKLTVLRMAVQHMKTLRGSIHSFNEGQYKPSFLSDDEVKRLVLEVAEGFLFVVGCDRGKILYVSESVKEVLSYSQRDLLGQSWFDILHQKDIAKVKEQLSSSDLTPRDRPIDTQTLLPVKTEMLSESSRVCPGARRSFFCRMKTKTGGQGTSASYNHKEEADTTTGCYRRRKSQSASDGKYTVIHCTGYLKCWQPAKVGLKDEEGESSGCSLRCLVAVGRRLPSPQTFNQTVSASVPEPPIEYVSRHTVDGRFVYVDQRATAVLGYLPQELLGASCYEFYHQEDISHLSDTHAAVLQSHDQVTTQVYRFRKKNGTYLQLQTRWKSFRNPWTKDLECLIARNTVLRNEAGVVDSSMTENGSQVSDGSLDSLMPPFAAGNSSMSDTNSNLNFRVGASQIGQQIADKVLDSQQRADYSSSGRSPTSNYETAMPPVHERPVNIYQNKFSHNSIHSSNLSENVPFCAQELAALEVLDPIQQQPQQQHPQQREQQQQQHQRQQQQQQQQPQHQHEMVSDQTIVGNEGMRAEVNNPSEGNDETTMAVITSLLEADAALGGPVDFSGLPWPLP